MTLWVVGAGSMAQAYAKVLRSLDQSFEVIGRGEASAKRFELETGKKVFAGGLASSLECLGPPANAIVAVGVNDLAETAIKLIESGTSRILLEKPGGVTSTAIQKLHSAAVSSGASVFVAYNRRFYASTAIARELIAADGGALTCNFEFTEWSHVIAPLVRPQGLKEAWFLANSTHVVDLAFHLCGYPEDWKAWTAGALDWHPAAARFCGAGRTERGVLFSYFADWEAPGRWGVEVSTRKRRFIFRPMEQLQVMRLGSTLIEPMKIDDRLDTQFKPGLFAQTKAFLDLEDGLLCSINEQQRHSGIYDVMAGYN